VDRPNVFGSEWDLSRRGVKLASVTGPGAGGLLGATVYELDEGARWAELHVHYANEELILVLTGSVTLHGLEESRALATGNVVVCPRGRQGAHRLENTGGEAARVLIVSTLNMPEIVEYPEQGNVFVMTEGPYTDGVNDPDTHGRIVRVFSRDDGRPVPPDS
jgi:uncharacterized cupin superfamily protein